MYRLSRPFTSIYRTSRFASFPSPLARSFRTSPLRTQEHSDPQAHRNFYKSHGRALLKALTLAFFSFQVFYYVWLTLETEDMKDRKEYEIQSLEGEVRLLEESRKSHRPVEGKESVAGQGSRILEEGKRA